MAKKRERRTIKHLPGEITEEILYNLPIKSLLRFKCVSRSWLSIISSKAFVKEHLKRSIAKDDASGLTDLSHHKLLFTYKYYDETHGQLVYSLGSSSLRSKPIIEPTSYDHPIRDSSFGIIGSCNGLILMRCNNNFYVQPLILWNPSTRKSRVIQSPSFGLVPREKYFRVSFYNFMYELGYDESNDEYKVVCIREHNLEERDDYETYVYSSKTDSWKKIESFNKRYEISHSGKLLNGRLHWLARPDSSYSHCEIISLDLVGEKYQYQTLFCIGDFGSVSLVELGGYLGVTSFDHNRDVNVWVMKEYGVRESWTKIWTLSDFVDDPRKRPRGRIPRPLCWRKNGDIVVVYGDDVFVCNGKNMLRKSRVCMPHDIVHSFFYVESLVSPLIDEQ